jgi:hypothetical protein
VEVVGQATNNGDEWKPVGGFLTNNLYTFISYEKEHSAKTIF